MANPARRAQTEARVSAGSRSRMSERPFGHHQNMDLAFSLRADGQVDLHLGPAWPMFNEALSDSISSLPPRGAQGNGPSTYWIDVAEAGVLRAAETGDTRRFTGGNVTLLKLEGDQVVATLDFSDDEPRESMPIEDFLDLLREWRRRVLVSAASASSPLPETYRRNPGR
jgi:hypothetical protein